MGFHCRSSFVDTGHVCCEYCILCNALSNEKRNSLRVKGDHSFSCFSYEPRTPPDRDDENLMKLTNASVSVVNQVPSIFVSNARSVLAISDKKLS